jgi:microcystin degradation protein MlrC
LDSAKRVLLAGISHETHSFVAETTPLGKFTIRRGPALLGCAGDGSMVDGFLEVAAGEGWSVVPVAMYRAQPAGRIEHAVFEAFWAELAEGVRAALAEGPLDAIWLALHGAGLTTECDDIEGELLGRLRALPGIGRLPVFGAFDLHANFTDAMARHATALVGFRENPHIDARDTAVRSARLLARLFRDGVTPHMLAARVPVIWPPTGTGTAVAPMRDLEAEARRIEAANPEIWAVNVIGGYAFSDVADAGVAFSLVTTGDDASARAALQSLCDIAIRLRDLGQPEECDLDAALAEIKARPASGKPWIVIEPADNIGGGSAGDCTSVLRGFIRHGIGSAVVAIADPAAVAALAPFAPGAGTTLSIGGKGDPMDPGPVELRVRLVSRSDGRFDLEDRNSHMAANGIHVEMGPSAVVETEGGITILLNSIKTAPMDLGQLRSQGIVPEEKAVIAVKAAVAHRRAYDPIAAGSTIVATPGVCTSRLTTLPYRRLRRPIHPLDEV